MKFIISALLIIGLAMIAESHVLKRQVQTGDPDIDSFWNSFNPTPATGNQRPTTGNQRPTVPTQRPTTQSPQLRRCIQNCLTTTEYNPVCGSDGVQYNNIGRLNCARNCGVNVSVATRAACNPLT